MIDARPALLLMATAVLPVARSAAQNPGMVDAVRDSARAAWNDLGTRCITPVANPYALPPHRSTCRVESLRLLGQGDGRDWYVARYLRELIVRDSGWADTMPMDELLLAGRRPGGADVEVVLRWSTDRREVFLDTVIATTGPQGLLLDLSACLNGTGGCGHDYFRLAGGRWRPVVQAFVADLGARLPRDRSLHKGLRLDLGTGIGVWPVATREDANCCPSFEIPFRVRLDGDTLRLVEAGPLRRIPDP